MKAPLKWKDFRVKFLIDDIFIGGPDFQGSGNEEDSLNDDEEDYQEPRKYIYHIQQGFSH